MVANNLADVLLQFKPLAQSLIDFEVRDDGAGPFISRWNVAKLGPLPTAGELATADAQVTASADKRDGKSQLAVLAMEYLIAFIVNQEFGNNTRLVAVKAKIAAWKSAHPGVVP